MTLHYGAQAETRVRKVLGLIAGLNAHFIDALAECARRRPLAFPLPPSLRADFSRLTQSQCCERGTYGIALTEARFTDRLQWSRVGIRDPSEASIAEHEHWLLAPEAMLMAHSVSMVAWHVVQSLPSFVGVLLGMSDEVANEIGKLRISDLAHFARTRSCWVQPRWPDRADLWSRLVDAGPIDSDVEPVPILRLLQASATESPQMLNIARLGTTTEQ